MPEFRCRILALPGDSERQGGGYSPDLGTRVRDLRKRATKRAKITGLKNVVIGPLLGSPSRDPERGGHRPMT